MRLHIPNHSFFIALAGFRHEKLARMLYSMVGIAVAFLWCYIILKELLLTDRLTLANFSFVDFRW